MQLLRPTLTSPPRAFSPFQDLTQLLPPTRRSMRVTSLRLLKSVVKTSTLADAIAAKARAPAMTMNASVRFMARSRVAGVSEADAASAATSHDSTRQEHPLGREVAAAAPVSRRPEHPRRLLPQPLSS